MKILHTSDLHLGINLYGLNMTFAQQGIAETFRNIIINEKINIMLIAGDVFDTSLASAEAIMVWSDLVTVLCAKLNIPVIVCAGNHDGATRLSSCGELLKASGLYISGHLEYDIKPVIIGNTAIYSVPYFNPAGAAEHFGCEKASPNAVMTSVLDKIRSEMDYSKTNILVSHCFVNGGEVSESDVSARASVAVGGAGIISASVFEGFDYVALGHLHRAQTIYSPHGTIIRYSGTPNAYSFGEASQTKTVSIFDTETKTVSEIILPEMFRLRELTDTYENLLNYAAIDENRDDYMKITVTDQPKGLAIYSHFKEIYPNMLRFAGMEYDNTINGRLSAREVAELDIYTLFERYYTDIFKHEPDSEAKSWIAEALKETEGLYTA